jgi:hypothetical protein
MPKKTATTQVTETTATQSDQWNVTELTDEQIIQQMREVYSKFGGTEFQEEKMLSFPRAKFMNNPSPNHGIFISQSSLEESGWHGEFPSMTTIRYRTSKNEEQGLLINEANPWGMQILYKSPLFVELKDPSRGKEDFTALWKPLAKQLVNEGLVKEDERLYALKPYSLLCPYDHEIYQILRECRMGSVATFWFFFLVDDQGNPFHDIPICLSSRGLASMNFNKQFDLFIKEIEKLRCQITGETFNPSANKGQVFKALTVFTPIIEAQMQGSADESMVATTTAFVSPSLRTLPQFFFPEKLDQVREQQEFIGKHIQALIESTGYHKSLPSNLINPTAPAPALNPSTGEDLVDRDPFCITTDNFGEAIPF